MKMYVPSHLHVKTWKIIVNELVELLKVARPDHQTLYLKIVTEVCRNDVFVELVRNLGLHSTLVKFLTSINDELAAEACLTLSVLANSNENRKYIASFNAIKLLVDLLFRSQNEDVLQKAITAIWTLALADDVKPAVRELGGIEAICAMLKSPYEAVIESATIALGYLTRDEENKAKLRDCDGLKLLFECLSIPKESIQHKAAGALWNCASNADNKAYMREIGGIAILSDQLDTKFESVLENVTGTLWNLAVDNENKSTCYKIALTFKKR